MISPTSWSDFTDHECDEDKAVDCDICSGCGEHASFCTICGCSNCCNDRPGDV